MLRTTQIKGISALTVSTAVLLAVSFLIDRHSSVSSALILIAGIQSIVAFWALLWSLPKSDRLFFSVFVGDALLRLAALGAAVLWVHSVHEAYTLPLLSLGLSYLILSLVQIPFFHRAV